jgi:regulatory protein
MTSFQALVRLLSARERTAADLRARLARKGFPPSAIEASLERAVELGYVDDLRAARDRAARIIARGTPRAVIESKLQEAGVSGAILAEVLAEAPDDRALAEIALARRFRSRLPSAERAGRFLAGRGFELELIEDVLRKMAG